MRETILRRFFTLVPTLEGPLLRALTSVDHDDDEALKLIHRMNDRTAGRFEHGEIVYDLPLHPAA